jgi:acetolactate synthase I/II/III large subunit
MYLNGGQIIFNKLIQNNTKNVFMYSGGAIMTLIDCFYNQNKINYFINTHEQHLGHSATGYARSTGNPGICIVTSGPGITNMITPMLDAQNDSCPLIVFSGNVPKRNMGTNAFQEAPAIEITKPFTKWSYCVDNIDELGDVCDEAFKISQLGKKGVVHIDLPKCILSSKKKTKIYSFRNNKVKQKNKTYNKNNKKNNILLKNKSNINEIVKVINNSKKPIFYVGQGCNDYSCELRTLINKSNIPITTTIHAMGVYNETKPLSLKFLGMHGSVYANKSIQEADCIIAVGSRFDDRTTGNLDLYAPKAKKAFNDKNGGIIHCNINKNEIGTIVDTHYNINADCGDFIKLITDKIIYKERTRWLSQINDWKNEFPFTYNDTDTLLTQDVLKMLNEHLINKEKFLFTSGVGNHQMMAAQFIDWTHPKSFISSGSLGVMGFGLPAAIGVAIGNPDKTVIDIDGDGSFLMTLSDMKTARQYNLKNLKVLLLNNKKLGMVDTWEKLFYNNRITATDNSHAPVFYDVAKTFGFNVLKCDNKKDLNKTIHEFIKTPGPLLCEFNVGSTECFPLVAPGKALDDIIINNTSNINMENMETPS